jgi:hypothetical protein
MVKKWTVKPKLLDKNQIDLLDKYGYKKNPTIIKKLKKLTKKRKNNKTEKDIQKKLFYKEYKKGDDMEVKCIYGRIDIMTNNEIIEVKTAKYWKHALGQIKVYHKLFKNKKMRIHLFDHHLMNKKQKDEIIKVCKDESIKVTWD